MINVPLDKIIPVTYARDNFASIVNDTNGESFYILSRGGRPKVAIIDIAFLEKLCGQKLGTGIKVPTKIKKEISRPEIPEPLETVEALKSTNPIPPVEPPKVENNQENPFLASINKPADLPSADDIPTTPSQPIENNSLTNLPTPQDTQPSDGKNIPIKKAEPASAIPTPLAQPSQAAPTANNANPTPITQAKIPDVDDLDIG